MINSTTMKARLGMLILAAAAFACSDDNDASPVDSEKPVITLESPTGKDLVFGTTRVKATATDKDGIAKVQLFIDNETVPASEVTTGSIDYAWDTRKLADGSHTLRIVATDAAANTAEVQTTVTVRNTMLTFSVPAGYINAGYAYHIVVSDETGTVLAERKLENNSVFTLTVPDEYVGNGRFTMTFLTVSSISLVRTTHTLATYANMPFGNYGYPGATGPATESKGTGQISISGDIFMSGFNPIYLNGEGSVSTTINNTGLVSTVNLYQNKVGFLLTRPWIDPTEYFYADLVPGAALSYSQDDLRSLETKPVTVPVDGDVYVSMVGYYGTRPVRYLSSKKIARVGSDVLVPFMDANFSSIQTQLTVHATDGSYGYTSNTPTIPTTMKKLSGAKIPYTRKDNAVTIGAYESDALSIVTSAGSGSDMYSYTWYVYMSPATTAVVPQLPKTLVDAYNIPSFTDMAVKSGVSNSALEYKEYNGFDDFVDNRLNLDTKVPNVTETTTYLTGAEGASQGGRIGSRLSDDLNQAFEQE